MPPMSKHNFEEIFVVKAVVFIKYVFYFYNSGPRTKRPKKPPSEKVDNNIPEDKRPRTAFSGPQLARLKVCFKQIQFYTILYNFFTDLLFRFVFQLA